jgi:rSAM/selenodomain-associated transferase 2
MKKTPLLSVVIPLLNEESFIGPCLDRVFRQGSSNQFEVILVDAGSQDQTLKIAEEYPCEIIRNERRNRAVQMNRGARHAQGHTLFFLHADVIVPAAFDRLILTSIEQSTGFGLFPYDFYPSSPLLKINAWFTRKRWGFTGGGDQGLFVRRSLFEKTGGFNEALELMEDFDLFERLKKSGKAWEVLKHPLQVSSRKYRNNGYLKVQLINFMAVCAFRMGLPTADIRHWYERALTKKAGA